MRDTQKMKDKLELQLEGRHLFTLSLVVFLALGGAFWLGINVGKKLQREDPGAPQPDLLAALDAQKPAPPSPLTFQEELTRKHPVVAIEKPVAKPVEKPAEKVAEKPAEKPAEKVAEKPAEKPAEKQTLEQALSKVGEKPAEAVAAIPAGPPKPGDKFVEAIAEPVVELKPEAKSEPRPEPKPAPPVVAAPIPAPRPVPAEALATTRTPDGGGALKDALARASRPAPAQTAADGTWTLQLSAYQDRAEADRYLAGLRDRGYAPYIVEAKLPNKGTWFRVRMGRFASREAATRYLNDFQRETQIPAIVTSVQ